MFENVKPLMLSDTTFVSFGNKMVKLLINKALQQMVKNHLLRTYNIRQNCTNKYFSIFNNQTDIVVLKTHMHLTYVNTNRPLNLIILITMGDAPVCIYFDKISDKMYILNCQFSPILYKGTILEGELIEVVSGNLFMVSDVLTYLNHDLRNVSVEDRVSILKSVFLENGNYVYDDCLDPFEIIVKDFVPYSQLESFVDDYLPQTKYHDKISGVIMRQCGPNNKNIIYNFPKKNTLLHKTISRIDRTDRTANDNNNKCNIDFKSPQNKPNNVTIAMVTNKSVNEAKIDNILHPEIRFIICESSGLPDDYILKLLGYDNNLYTYDIALINDIKMSQSLQNYFKTSTLSNSKKGVCVLCTYNKNFKKWKPIKILEDCAPDNIKNVML
jgi:hypothetical protein